MNSIIQFIIHERTVLTDESFTNYKYFRIFPLFLQLNPLYYYEHWALMLQFFTITESVLSLEQTLCTNCELTRAYYFKQWDVPKAASKIREGVHSAEVIETHVFRRETGKTPNHIEQKTRKHNVIFDESEKSREKQDRNRNSHQNRKTEVSFYKTKKPVYNIGRKPKIPMHPSCNDFLCAKPFANQSVTLLLRKLGHLF